MAGQVCSNSACSAACASGLAKCGTSCVDLSTDKNNCGLCGDVCANNQVCNSSMCACASGTSDCNGTCADLQTANANCGTCGNACSAGTVCTNGVCN